ncbi:polysaccharide lyase family 1 protein [Actinoplanes sp. TRM 88003]|uniref:Polysaccharide lyase family 1 protein n=1 Tax=Paractinoplanes aksuensis TaxID=2939490 RepID=A0ABT1DJM1_9ACTN|nr:polysaccharide lyase family 1 protein [Actinoplanes aksuensis]MCO8271025.1 polysaccharide lyase family 1 protein [Actinoplanes aksuensis]
MPLAPVAGIAAALLFAFAPPAATPAAQPAPLPASLSSAAPSPAALQVARQGLAAGDGWASAGAGTTGGSAADDANVFVVRTRDELVAAVAGNTPKIVLVQGRIDLREGLGCDAFADPKYSLEAFLAAYDPAVWGRAAKPSGPLEDARVRSARNQGDQVRVVVGSNTTIVGVNGGRVEHGSLVLTNVSNVIVRNLEVTDAADCFPAWDPTDGSAGNWNSLYDLVSLSGATNVWLDHNTFSDGNNHDADQPVYFGRPYQVHDGATDFIRGSDLITVSWNDYYDHDKTMLIGSTDTPGVDVGKLRVTVHHNRFGNVIQRAPRVRFGQVDVYNNLYVATDEEYIYSLGVGVESSIYAENNYFRLSADVPASDVIAYWKGTRITAIGSLVQVSGRAPRPVDLVAAYNAAHDPDLTPDAGWTPTLRTQVHPTVAVPAVVSAGTGIRRVLR